MFTLFTCMQVYNSHHSRNNHYTALSLDSDHGAVTVDAETMVLWPRCSYHCAVAMMQRSWYSSHGAVARV